MMNTVPSSTVTTAIGNKAVNRQWQAQSRRQAAVWRSSPRNSRRSLTMATGAGHRKLGVPGEETLAGAGVSYCATCDGAFFRNKTVAVVGGGDVALEDALYLAAGCEKVYLIHRRQELRGTKVLQEQVANEPKITFLPDTVVKEICGEQMVDHLVIANTGTGEEKELPVSGIFIAVGMNPQTDAVASVLDLDHGYVRAGEDGVTEQPGFFVAGDVRTKKLRQIVTAVADGAKDVVQLREQKIQPAHIAPQHTGGNAHGSFDDRHEKGDGQAGARARPDARPQVLSDGVGAPEKALLPWGDVAVLDAGGGVYGAKVGVCLPGQQRLHKGEHHHRSQRSQQRHGKLVFKKGTEGAAPVAVTGAGSGFGLLAAEPGGGEKLLLRQGCPRGGAVLLQGV